MVYNNGDVNSLQYTFEWEPKKSTKKYYPDVVLSMQKIYEAQSQQQDFFSWYRHIFSGYKLNYFFRWCLDLWSFIYEGLGIYPIWTKYIFFFTTLDGSAPILRPKQLMTFLHSVFFTTKMGSEFSLFSATSLTVSKIDPPLIGSSRKICTFIVLFYFRW